MRSKWEGEVEFDERLYAHDRRTYQKKNDMDTEDMTHNLTSEDFRLLLIAEDELTRIVVFRRIFPTEESWKYFQFIQGERYKYELMVKWEKIYAKERSHGRRIFESVARIGLHLNI
jgi:hypothetical protein